MDKASEIRVICCRQSFRSSEYSRKTLGRWRDRRSAKRLYFIQRTLDNSNDNPSREAGGWTALIWRFVSNAKEPTDNWVRYGAKRSRSCSIPPTQPELDKAIMLICHSKRFVILAPWKTASQTVLLRLGRYSEGSYDQFYDFNHVLGRVVHQHMTCADFAALPEAQLGYFVASFVRNPYDRVYSGFQQLREDLVNQPRAQFRLPWVREFVMRQLADNFSQLCAAGFDFDKWVKLIRDDQIFEAGRNTSFPLHPAHYWTHLGDRQLVNFIGRVETFEGDFDRLCAQLGVIPDSRENANVRNAPSGPAYRHAGNMARASIDRINELFREDFERLGYKPL